VPLAVIGPMARTAADLDLAMGVLAGPAPEEAVGYSLSFPDPRQTRLADFRVLILDHHPAAPTSAAIVAALRIWARGWIGSPNSSRIWPKATRSTARSSMSR